MIDRAGSTGMSASIMAVLMLSVFTVSMGYGVVLPLLPYLIERMLGTGSDAAQVSRSTGLLTGLYTLSLFLFAPAWGRMSDRYGRRAILMIGLFGFSATMLTFAFIENLPAIYAERFLSGLFASAVTPVALAAIGDLATTDETRARRLTFVSIAGIGGFLLGPMLGVLMARAGANLIPGVNAAGSLAVPLAGTAILAFLVAIAAAMAIPRTTRGDAATTHDQGSAEGNTWLIPQLLALAFIVSAGVGVFEVGLALRGKQELGLTQYQIALMFTECSLVMIVVQSVVFSPWIKPDSTRWFIAPALAVLAIGLFFVPRASNFILMLAVIGAVAASAGILSPILTYWISSKARVAQGAELGKQTAAASLGAAMGSAAGGLLFNVTPLPGASFLLVAALTVLGFVLSLRLPYMLVTRTLGGATYTDGIGISVFPAAQKSGRYEVVGLAITSLRPVLKTILNPIVRSSLRKRMDHVEVEHLLDRTWKLYPTYLSSINAASLGVGPALVLRLAACTAAIHAALVAAGETHEEAIRITADVGWSVYRWMGRIPWLLSGIISHDPRKRLVLSTEIFRSFPFASPAYGWRNKSAPEGVVAFDCVRCPVAEYFSTNGLSDLCVQTFCNLDFPLAKEWGAELERTSSIAAGASVCDFRWRTKPSQWQNPT